MLPKARIAQGAVFFKDHVSINYHARQGDMSLIQSLL
jgi:hypothetical protein